MRHAWTLLVALLSASCGGSRSPGATASFSHGWDGWDDPDIGCVAAGGVQHLRGALRVPRAPDAEFEPKSFDGTELVLDNGDTLVVAYGATTQHRDLAGMPIVAHGRFCNKRGQAIVSQHFDIDTLTILDGTSRTDHP